MRVSFFAIPLLLSLPAAAAGSSQRVGVVAIERRGAADPAYEALVQEMRASVERLTGTAALDLSDERRCDVEEADCWRALARKSTAAVLVRATVERTEHGYQLAMSRFDAEKGVVPGRSRLVAGGAPDLLATSELALCELLLPGDRCEGELAISGTSSGIAIVDGKDAGALPWRAAVAIGRHGVGVRTDSVTSPERFVRVSYRRTTPVESEPGTPAAEPSAVKPAAVATAVTEPGGKARPRPKRKDVTGFDELPPIPDIDDENVTAAPAPVAVPPPPVAVSAPASQAPAPAPVAPVPVSAPVPAPPVVAQMPVAPPPPAAVAEAPTKPSETSEETRASTDARPGSARWIGTAFRGGLVLGGIGMVSGVVAGLLASSAASDANDKFDARQLTVADAALYESARTRAAVANVSYGLGSVGLLAAAVLYLIDPTLAGSGGDAGLAVGVSGIQYHGSFR